MVVISPAEILNSSRSYEAIATQKCSKTIAERVDPDQFTMALFSEMFLTNEEAESLRNELQSTPLRDRGKTIQNFHIMLEVHRKISENSDFFINLGDALKNIDCFRFKVLLYGRKCNLCVFKILCL